MRIEITDIDTAGTGYARSNPVLRTARKIEAIRETPVCAFCGQPKVLGSCSNPACGTTTVCAWCNSVVNAQGYPSGIPIPEDAPLTHTICGPCGRKCKEELREEGY